MKLTYILKSIYPLELHNHYQSKNTQTCTPICPNIRAPIPAATFKENIYPFLWFQTPNQPKQNAFNWQIGASDPSSSIISAFHPKIPHNRIHHQTDPRHNNIANWLLWLWMCCCCLFFLSLFYYFYNRRFNWILISRWESESFWLQLNIRRRKWSEAPSAYTCTHSPIAY